MLLTAENISRDYGDKKIINNLTLYLNRGDRLGLIGINGTGKSTLLRILAGVDEPDSGRVSTDPNVQIAYLPQTPVMDDENTVLEQMFASHPDSWRDMDTYEARRILSKLGIEDPEQKVGTLSGGQKKRAALASVFVHPSDVLILDEPTNHLDHEMVEWLENRLRSYAGAIVMVTHDRYFLDRVTNRIGELSHGDLFVYTANYSKYLELKAERLEMAQASERKRQALLRKETAWIMRGCRARSTKSTERIERYEALKAQNAPETDEKVVITGAATRMGKKTIEIEGVSKSFDGRTVIKEFSYNVLRDDRIGIVGRNGAGKSTLLNLIAGRLEPDVGSVETGTTVRIGYFTQEGKELNPKQRPYDYIHEIASSIRTIGGTITATQMLERFQFSSSMQFSEIGRLSGGERRRLYLLGILMSAPNVLLLDEPTNDLDIETLMILEDYLETYPGAVIAVSHDRYFLDKIAESIFEVGIEGTITRTMGNYSDYTAQKLQTEVPVAKKKTEKTVQTNEKQKRGKLKFSFKEQREYDTIDEVIAQIEQKLAENESEITENSADYVKLQELTVEKERLEAELDEKTERWVYLNDLADRIARGETYP